MHPPEPAATKAGNVDPLTVSSPRWRQLIIEGAREMGVAVSPSQADRMAWCAAELLAWNRRINLTAITDPADVALKHFVDALAPTPRLAPGARLLDAGCGAGFPGVPLKIVRPDLRLTLIDAVRKKISFVAHLIRGLGLEQTEARHARLEDLGRQAPRPVFDVVVCRALGPFSNWLEAAVALLAEGGFVLAFKGPQVRQELDDLGRAADRKGGLRAAGRRLTVTVTDYRLPVSGDRRCLVYLTPGPPSK